MDRLMKQISTFMSEISDEFKIVVVQAIRYKYIPPRASCLIYTYIQCIQFNRILHIHMCDEIKLEPILQQRMNNVQIWVVGRVTESRLFRFQSTNKYVQHEYDHFYYFNLEFHNGN